MPIYANSGLEHRDRMFVGLKIRTDFGGTEIKDVEGHKKVARVAPRRMNKVAKILAKWLGNKIIE
jgi:hypothetical protein